MADTAPATPETRPLVPHLRLGETREEDYLFGSKCQNCGTLYVGPRQFCGKCSTTGSFDDVRLGRDGEVHVYSIIHQATPYVKAPYAVGVVDALFHHEDQVVRSTVEPRAERPAEPSSRPTSARATAPKTYTRVGLYPTPGGLGAGLSLSF